MSAGDAAQTADLILHLCFGYQAMGKSGAPQGDWSRHLVGLVGEMPTDTLLDARFGVVWCRFRLTTADRNCNDQSDVYRAHASPYAGSQRTR